MNLPPDVEPQDNLYYNETWKHPWLFALAMILVGVALACLMIGILIFFMPEAHAEEITQASWYSRASCLREGTSGIMANGKELKDEALVCASWDYNLKTMLKVTNMATDKTVIVEVCDRGPSKKLYKKGRKLDLSKGAFAKIANLKSGVIQVAIEQIKKVRSK